MKKSILFLVLIALTSFDVKAWDWQTTSNVLIIADWGQTLDISARDDYFETNPILGKYPSRGEVNTYFLTCLILNNVIGEYIGGDGWYMAISFNQAVAVGHNIIAGINFNF